MTDHTQPDPRRDRSAPTRRIRRRGPIVALAVVLACIGAACAPNPTDPGAIDIDLGPLTVPLGDLPSTPTTIGITPLPGCTIGFTLPSLVVKGVTATIPKLTINPAAGTVSVPNITVNIPAVGVNVGTIQACLFPIDLGTISVPATVAVKSGTLNLSTGVLTIDDPTVTLQFSLLGIPLPVTLPLPDINIPLT